ncbi:MAG TPA: hypothetical protein VGM54_01735 [Chthoniobacter sp.]|jgi:hypothetical protein
MKNLLVSTFMTPLPPPPPPPLPFAPPPLPESKGSTSLRALASYSWVSIVLSLIVHLSLRGALNQGAAKENARAMAIVAGFFVITGVLAGIIALLGIRRHGRKGLLAPAVTGISIWVVLLAIGTAGFLAARGHGLQQKALSAQFEKTPPVHIPGALRVQDAELGYSFDLPPGFQAFPEAQKPKEFRAAYINRGADGSMALVLVKALGGLISPYKRMTLQSLPPEKHLTLAPFAWRGMPIDGVRLPEKTTQGDFITFNVQIPIKKQAIQIGFGALASDEAQTHALAEQVLATLDGPVSW